MKRVISIVAVLLLTISSLAFAKEKTSKPLPKVTDLMTKVLADVPGKEVSMITVDYPPGGADPVHRHNAHAFVYVLEGSIVMAVAGGKETTVLPGEIFYEGPGDLHTVGRNASEREPAKFVVFLLKGENSPVFIPVD